MTLRKPESDAIPPMARLRRTRAAPRPPSRPAPRGGLPWVSGDCEPKPALSLRSATGTGHYVPPAPTGKTTGGRDRKGRWSR